jgi:hypothetical protein
MWVTFFPQTISIMLQRMQASSILIQAIGVGLATSQLPPLYNTLLVVTSDLLQVVDYLDGEILTSSLC